MVRAFSRGRQPFFAHQLIIPNCFISIPNNEAGGAATDCAFVRIEWAQAGPF